tara:strand:- start:56 stop:421 length:366 start_codon:yes stop_codon:yes gene_type:complete
MNWKEILKEDKVRFEILEIPYGQTTKEGPLIRAFIERDELRFGIEKSVIGKILKLLKENKNAYERFDKKSKGPVLSPNEYEIVISFSKNLEDADIQDTNLDKLLTKIKEILKSSKYVKVDL